MNGKPPIVQNSVMQNRIEGCLHMIDMDMYVIPQKANRVKRLVEKRDTVPYHYRKYLPGISYTRRLF